MKSTKRSEGAVSTDVIVLGGGLAGLTLARHLLLHTDKRVVLLEKRPDLPPKNQKVGESTVQVAGFYLSKLLDLEEYLLREHLMKYNLRFYWKTRNRRNDSFDDYGQAYIRNFSNIASYQVDRNRLEGELLRLNRLSDRFDARLGEAPETIALGPPHRVTTKRATIEAPWIVDTTGRQRLLPKTLGNDAPLFTRHASSFAWVEGLVDIDKLTPRTGWDNLTKPERKHTGHLPFWLATNHFFEDGLWFWVIPLQGMTSLGLVFDKEKVSPDEVNTPEKLFGWVEKRFPLFAADLRSRKLVGSGSLKELSLDCRQTIHPSGWAISGEAGRFLDPLYSPGSDFIAIHNTLIVAAIESPEQRAARCQIYDAIQKAYFEAFIPSFDVSYGVLGDQECFVMKYTWELGVYFTYYVFPFINNMIADPAFGEGFLKSFATLGPINRNLHHFLAEYREWKRKNTAPPAHPIFHELTRAAPLRSAEKLFYQVGIDIAEAHLLLETQQRELRELAALVYAHVTAIVAEAPELLCNAAFIESIEPGNYAFDPIAMRLAAKKFKSSHRRYEWRLDPSLFDVFHEQRRSKKKAA